MPTDGLVVPLDAGLTAMVKVLCIFEKLAVTVPSRVKVAVVLALDLLVREAARAGHQREDMSRPAGLPGREGPQGVPHEVKHI